MGELFERQGFAIAANTQGGQTLLHVAGMPDAARVIIPFQDMTEIEDNG